MRPIDALRVAVAAQGLVPGDARHRRGVTLVWLRPEPVTLRLDAAGRLVLEAYLPFVLPGGKLHRRVRMFLAERHGEVACVSRHGGLGLRSAAEAGPQAALARLLAAAQGLQRMLEAEWPDYARGVFAAEPGRSQGAG